ncbi:MAG: EamA family transporter RarD [Acidimicrobiia bacterium]
MDERRAGTLTGAAAYVLWGLLTLYWHELSGLDPFGIVAWRVVWSTVLLAIALTIARRWADLRPVWRDRALTLRVLGAGVALAINWTSYVWCVTHGHVIETALGYFLAPIGLVLVGVITFHEHLRRVQQVALALAGVAVVVLGVGYGAPPVFALLMATTWTVYGMLKKSVRLPMLESLAAECLVLAPVAIAMLLGLQTFGAGSLAGATTAQWVLVPLTGVATTIPLLLFAHAAPRVPLATLGWLQYSVPTINLTLGVLLYGEAMPGWRIAGFGLVWLGLALITVDALRSRTPALEPA